MLSPSAITIVHLDFHSPSDNSTNMILSARFQTYFPHIDNVYSHRSTQRHKRHSFVSHYWDCRLIGRPSGTPKSEDPSKKKRKRVARERNLCDVKIKIVELPPTTPADSAAVGGHAPTDRTRKEQQATGALAGRSDGKKYEITRVSGVDENGRTDGMAGAHKHSLEESDRVKKNSVVRYFAALEKEIRDQTVGFPPLHSPDPIPLAI